MTRPTPSTEKQRRRQELAAQMAAWEAKNGPVVTEPLRQHPESLPTTERQRKSNQDVVRNNRG